MKKKRLFDVFIDVYMKRVTALMLINKKKVRREGLNTRYLSPTDDSDSTDDDTASSKDESCVSSTLENRPNHRRYLGIINHALWLQEKMQNQETVTKDEFIPGF